MENKRGDKEKDSGKKENSNNDNDVDEPDLEAELAIMRARREENLHWGFSTEELDGRIQKFEEALNKNKQMPSLKVVEGQLTAAQNQYQQSLAHLAKAELQYKEAIFKASENKQAVEDLETKKEEILRLEQNGGFRRITLVPIPANIKLSDEQLAQVAELKEASDKMLDQLQEERNNATKALFETFVQQAAETKETKEAAEAAQAKTGRGGNEDGKGGDNKDGTGGMEGAEAEETRRARIAHEKEKQVEADAHFKRAAGELEQLEAAAKTGDEIQGIDFQDESIAKALGRVGGDLDGFKAVTTKKHKGKDGK